MNVKVLKVCTEVLNKKPITTQEARNKFKEVMYDYLNDLSTIESINLSVDSKAYSHKQYLIKLITLADRYESIGTDALPNELDKIDTFLSKLQDMIRDYLNRDLDKTFYSIRREHYSKLSFNQRDNQGIEAPSYIANLKEQAFRNIKNNNLG